MAQHDPISPNPFGEIQQFDRSDIMQFAPQLPRPEVTANSYSEFSGQYFQPHFATWSAHNFQHKPLYFEERSLERYGHTDGELSQPIISGAHFFLNIAVLPYKMGINPPNECQYALGYYRPGSCAPWLLPPVPLSVRGGLYQAGAITGLVFLLP